MTDETSEMTEQTKMNISPILIAKLGIANKNKMEEKTYARNQNNGACQAV